MASWILWILWTTKKQNIFNNKSYTIEDMILKSIKDAKKWQEAQTKKQINLPSSARFDLPHFLEFGTKCKSDAAWRANIIVEGL